MQKRIAIIGAGNMGTAMSLVLADNGYQVKLWDINKKVVNQINKKRVNKTYLPNVHLPESISASNDIAEVTGFSNVLILAIPSQFLRSTLKKIPKKNLEYEIIVNCAKGIDLKTDQFMSEIVEEELGPKSHGIIADLSGPSIANELSKKHLTAVIVASKNEKVLNFLQKIFNNDYFKVRTSTDVIGTELGGVMKNIYSIAIGMSDVLVDSMNTRALLLTEALSEMAVLGTKLGASKESFYSLSGIGDLIATCLSHESRNYRFGRLLAEGKSVEKAMKKIHQVVEGYHATKAISSLAKKHKVKLPLAENMYKVLYNEKPAKEYLLRGF
jgi:glycerol-3-phosphate dehydrogenase (NAD(P)+)